MSNLPYLHIQTLTRCNKFYYITVKAYAEMKTSLISNSLVKITQCTTTYDLTVTENISSYKMKWANIKSDMKETKQHT